MAFRLHRTFRSLTAMASVRPPARTRNLYSRFFPAATVKFQRHHRRWKLNAEPFLYCGALGGLTAFLSQEGVREEEDEEEDEETKATNELIKTIKLGLLALQREQYDHAENMLHIALRMAQDLNNYDGITYVYDQLANVAFERGDYMKSERLFKEVMSRILSTGSVEKDDNKIIEMSLKLSRVYATWGEHEKAEIGYRFCIATQEKKIASGDAGEDTMALWGMSKDWFAQYLLDRGKAAGAMDEFRSAYETCKELFGESHPQTLVLLNSLGTVASVMGDDMLAVSYFQRAVELAKAAEDENVATYYVNLGMARIKLGKVGDALNSCNEGLRLAKFFSADDVVEEAKECLKEAKEAGMRRKKQKEQQSKLQ